MGADQLQLAHWQELGGGCHGPSADDAQATPRPAPVPLATAEPNASSEPAKPPPRIDPLPQHRGLSGRNAKDKGQESKGSYPPMTLLRVQIPALPLVSCVTSGKSLDLSVPQFLHLQNRVDDEHKGTYFKVFCQGLTKLILLKH